MAQTEFKAESKRLLELMINSIYTNKEIFLREIISNASDASDKRYFNALSNGESGVLREDLAIIIKADVDNKILSITDHGCGMTKPELEEFLGTIAHSGSLDFKSTNEKSDEIDIIGQFGVGFYSSFMVAESITVNTKSISGDAFCWFSDSVDGYTISEIEKDTIGTEIILKIKEDTEDEKYSEFLSEYPLKSLIRKYSDYIRYPIQMMVTSSKKKADSTDENPEWEEIKELVTLNSMTPIWKKSKSEVTADEYNEYYKSKFFDWEAPLKVISTSTEGASTYNALLFVPAKAPMNFYNKEWEKGLALYASGVMIMEHCADLLPDYFSFMRGVVDSQDLSLNISREILQQDRQLKLIATRIEKKIKSELLAMLANDREKYEQFFTAFGVQLKFGVYNSYGSQSENLKDLLLFKSSNGDGFTTISEYVSRMGVEQTTIYYASGESTAQIALLPQAERLVDKGFEILYLTDDVDEFTIKALNEYDSKQFQSISDSKIEQTEEEKVQIEQKSQDHTDLLKFAKNFLAEKVSDVRLTSRLKSFPVCLTADGDLSLDMEKVLNSMPTDQKVKATKVLELNFEHPVFQALASTLATDSAKAEIYLSVLYNQALLIEGLPIENPVEFANDICKLMTK